MWRCYECYLFNSVIFLKNIVRTRLLPEKMSLSNVVLDSIAIHDGSRCSARRMWLYRSLHNTIIPECWSIILSVFCDNGFDNGHHLFRHTQQI